MKPCINLSPEGNLIQIFIPAKLGRHSGHKSIKPINPDRNEAADTALLNALIRAHRWQRELQNDKTNNVTQLAKDDGITSASYTSPILRLTLLAPDIQEMILCSGHPSHLTLADFMGPFPYVWEEQRRRFGVEHAQ